MRQCGGGSCASAGSGRAGFHHAGRVARHVQMLAVFWIALSALNLLKAGGRFVGARVVGVLGTRMV